ncbi:unnamed protein product [Brassica rapa subsp. trilocularis]
MVTSLESSKKSEPCKSLLTDFKKSIKKAKKINPYQK